MRVFGDQNHQDHWVNEFANGVFELSWEKPIRADHVDAELDRRGFPTMTPPDPVPQDVLHRVHTETYITFLERAWDLWCEAGRGDTTSAHGFCWPTRGMTRGFTSGPEIDIERANVDALFGHFSFAADCGIGPGTASAAWSAAGAAFTAANSVAADPDQPAFARCRPPGHHAMTDSFGGYCYLNNAAIAAQRLRDLGADRVAVIDVDYHHGNGTQEIFYRRADVTVASIHGDPAVEFPYFSGFADETGVGEGEGANLNLPLPWGTTFDVWLEAFDQAAATAEGADAVVVSLGVDTFTDDPISQFKLVSDDYLVIGRRLAELGRPTVFIMEGGYATEAIGVNMVNVLDGFAQRI